MGKIKAIIIAIGTLVGAALGDLAAPVLIMLTCNIIDYITAIIAAPKRGQEISSNIGMAGIRKKVMMWVLVVVGGLLDILLQNVAGRIIHIEIPIMFLVATFVAIWLSVNEMISIAENAKDIIGEDRMPPFLLPLLKNVRSQVNDAAKDSDKLEG